MSSYNKSYYEMHKEERKAATKAWKESNIDKYREYQKAYRESHNEHIKAYNKAYQEAHKEQQKEYKKEYMKAYRKSELNSLGQTKCSIRSKSQHYINKYGKVFKSFEDDTAMLTIFEIDEADYDGQMTNYGRPATHIIIVHKKNAFGPGREILTAYYGDMNNSKVRYNMSK